MEHFSGETKAYCTKPTPDASVSKLGLRNRKQSGCGSAYSRSYVVRAKEAASIAELQAKVHALKQCQLIHETK